MCGQFGAAKKNRQKGHTSAVIKGSWPDLWSSSMVWPSKRRSFLHPTTKIGVSGESLFASGNHWGPTVSSKNTTKFGKMLSTEPFPGRCGSSMGRRWRSTEQSRGNRGTREIADCHEPRTRPCPIFQARFGQHPLPPRRLRSFQRW